MPKINVLVLPSDRHGVGKYRSIDPHTFLQNNYKDDFHVDIVFEPPTYDDNYFKKYQIIHFHTLVHRTNDFHESFDLSVKRLEWCKSQGIVTVCDVDDFWMPDQYHPLYHMVKSRKDNEYRVKVMKAADWVSTTTPLYADEIKKRLGIKNVIVLPNALNEKEPQFQPNKEQSDLIRFGWLGGSSHQHDLELLKSNIASAHASYKNKIQFVLCGFDLRGEVTEIDSKTGEQRKRHILPRETTWYEYEKYFTDNYSVLDDNYRKHLEKFHESDFDDRNKPYRRVWTKQINKYAENYNKFDVSLAPIKDTLFNACKSQLKVIESGFHKKALIASNFGPYTIDLISSIDFGKIVKEGNALLVDVNKNHKQWFAHMKRLMDNPSMIEDLGEKLYETVYPKYSLSRVTETRKDFYKTITLKTENACITS